MITQKQIIDVLNQVGGGDLFSSVKVSNQLLSLISSDREELAGKIREIPEASVSPHYGSLISKSQVLSLLKNQVKTSE